MRQFGTYLKGLEKECVLSPLFKMLEAFFDLLVPLVVAQIINKGILQKDTGLVIRCVLILAALALIGLGCSVTAQYFAAKASTRFAGKVRQAVFDHVLSLSYSQIDTLGTGTLITRLTADINQMQTGVNMALRLLLRSPFIVFGSMIMAFTINVRCALIFAGAIPLLAIVVYGIMIVSIPLYKKVQTALDAVTVRTRENLTGVRVIRAFGKEKEEIAAFDEKSSGLTGASEFVGRISALLNPLTYVMINIATILLIRSGAVRVNLGQMQQGDVVALYNYMAQMIVELIKLASLIITINKAVACAGRVSSVLEQKPEMNDGGKCEKAAGRVEDSVVFSHVSLTYAGASEESLSDISFCVKAGETIGVIGGTGSGKSSLVNLIGRFYDATKGEIIVDGINVREWNRKDLINQIGIVPQKAVLFAGTIRDNLKWGNEKAGDAALWQAVEAAQAREVVEGKEGGLDYLLEPGGRNLSGGQRQRLTIARALVKDPEILILDDSASALDFATDARLRRTLRSMSGTRTTFIVSQRCSSVMQADRILVLADGRLTGFDSHEKLMETCGEYREIFYSQYPERRPDDRKGGDAV